MWDYGGKEAYVCVFQNGSQLTIPMQKSADGKYLEADAKLRPGRCEFRSELFWNGAQNKSGKIAIKQ